MEDNKKKILTFEESKVIKDSRGDSNNSGPRGSKIILVDQYTGEPIYTGHNKAILPSATFTAANAFKIPIENRNPSYNTELGLEYTRTSDANEYSLREKVVLFGVGTDGCGPDQHQVYDQNYSLWCEPQNIVPFRVQELDRDLEPAMREKYNGRAVKNNRIYYYFKEFDNEPIYDQIYDSDNTPVDYGVYTSNRINDEISSYVLLKMSIDEDDCIQFFKNTVGEKHAKINTIFTCFAIPDIIGNYTYYQEIRPYTKFNFPNEHLMHLKRGLDIFYYIYY